jgi:hypothetical protein
MPPHWAAYCGGTSVQKILAPADVAHGSHAGPSKLWRRPAVMAAGRQRSVPIMYYYPKISQKITARKYDGNNIWYARAATA